MNLFELFGTIAINSSVADQTIDDTMDKVKGLKDGLEGAETQAETTGKSLGKGSKLNSAAIFLGNTYTKIAAAATKIGTALVKTGFGFDASMEAYQNQFASLLGDADKAKQLVADLQELAKISPLGMEGLANNAVSLLNSGTALADILPTLEMLGNLSLGDTNKMNSVVRAYTQILSKGQLMAQEMYQLGDAGVPVREIMTLYGGKAYADGSWYQQKMSDPTYKIMAEDMVTAFQNATAEGGKWHDYMFKMMDTWDGQVDRMGESGKESLGAFFQPFFEVAKSDVLPKLSKSLEDFGVWVENNQETLTQIADAMGTLATGGFSLLLTTVQGLVDGIKALTEAWKTLKSNMTNINASITVTQQSVGSAVTQKTGSSFLGSLAESIVKNSVVNPDAPWLPRWNAEGAIFSKPTIFNTRLGLQGVGEAGAEAVAPIDKLQGYVRDAVRETVGGMQFNIVLDGGALVGQLAPRFDERLGTLASRKGRG